MQATFIKSGAALLCGTALLASVITNPASAAANKNAATAASQTQSAVQSQDTGIQEAQSLPLKGHVLEVGVAIAPPFVIADKGFNSLSGIDIELIKELQRRTGFKLSGGRIRLMNFSELLDVSASGALDITGGAISLSQEREGNYRFSDRSCLSNAVAVVRADSSISSLDDLTGKTVAAEVGTTAQDVLPDEYASKVKMRQSATNFMQFYDVARGHADALVADHAVAVDYINYWKDAGLKIAFELPESFSSIGLLFKKDDMASAELSRAFSEMKQDGTVDAIVDKYIPEYKHSGSRLAGNY